MVRPYLCALHVLSTSPLLATAIQTTCLWNPVTPSLQAEGQCVVPVDDDTPAHSSAITGSPWTHPPYCVTPVSVGSSDKFCVYTSSAYNGGSGISLIVKPEIAASVAPAVQDYLPAWRARRHLAEQGLLRAEAHELPYTVISIPGKGQGVVATRHIKQFETIITGFPAFIVDNEFFPPREDEKPAEGPRLFQKAINQLADKKRFLSLARSKGEHTHVVEDVTRTNAFGITVDGRDMKGLYPEIARLNHGCDANAYPRFTKKDLAMSAVATRDIEPGEEITISYIPLGMPTSHRKRALGNWGFNCTCELCSAPPEARDASDQTRERLVEIYYAMQDESTSYNTLVELTREFIKLAQVERLVARVGEYYQSFMRIYYSFGDVETAKKYGQTSLMFAEIFSDPEGGFCTGVRRDLGQIDEALRGKGAAEGKVGALKR